MRKADSSRFPSLLRGIFASLLILLIAVALHLFPLFLFSPAKKTHEKEQADRRFTVMVNQEPTLQNDPYDLYYWLTYGDPTLFARPNATDGFSAWLRTRASLPELSDADTARQISITRTLAFPETQYTFPLRTPAELLDQLRPPMPSLAAISMGKKEKKENSGYPRWTASDGTDLGNLFNEDEATLRQIRRINPQAPTVLLFKKGKDNMPPRVKLRQTCGNSQLDILASAALASYAEQKLESPILERLKYVIVDWRTGNTPKVKK